MLKNTVVLFNFFVTFVLFIVILSVFAYYSCKKYNEKRVKFYALFLNLTKREILLISSCLINVMLVLFLVMNISVFDSFTQTLLIINTILFVILAFNLRLMFIDIIYTGSMVLVLRLLFLVDSYLANVYFDQLVYSLKVVFMALIVSYCLISNVRKYEIILVSNKFVRRSS